MLLRLSEYLRLYVGLSTLGVLCLLWSALAVPLYPLLPARYAEPLGRWMIMRGFWFYLHSLQFIGACRFDLSELDVLRAEKQGLILAPNHPSLLDAVMVISKFPNIACIMKSTLMDSIFFGSGARIARYIRNDPPLHMINEAVRTLQRGSFLLLFPEGTRTITPPLNTCKPSAGLIAKRACVPVQTLLIETNSLFLGKRWPLFRRPDMPMIYRIRLGKRFAAPSGDVNEFVEEMETYLRDELQRATLQPPAPQTNASSTEFPERQPYA
ncbi:MAG TPA: lysophospholipid acyltransferase family protein [Spongiibacteraceae bacterium]